MLLLSDSIPGFAGAWLESDRLMLTLVESSGTDTLEARRRFEGLILRSRGELRHGYGSTVSTRWARFPFRQIHDWRRRFDNVQDKAGVIFTDSNEQTNTVAIGVQDEAAGRRTLSQLLALGVPEDAIRIVVVPWPRPSVSLVDVVSPTAGGVQVSVSWSESGVGKTKPSTLTGNVVWLPGDPNEHYFVTCAHCSAKAFRMDPAATWYQATVSHPPMAAASEVADPGFFSGGSCPSGNVCRWSEAAVIKYGSAGANWLPQVAWAPNPFTLEIQTFYAIDQSIFPIGNSWYYKTGRVTGSNSGTLTSTCVTFTPNFQGYMEIGDTLPPNARFLCQHWSSYASLGGDSGSPVYQIPSSPPSPTAVIMRGIHHAGASGTLSVFSPISGINKDLGTVRWDLY